MAIDSFRECLRIRILHLGRDHQDVATVWYNIATIHLERGDDDGALLCYRETLRVERAMAGETNPNVASTLLQLGSFHRHRGELDEALHCYLEALAIEKMHMRESSTVLSVAVCRTLNMIGNIYLERRDLPKMMEYFSEAMRMFETYGANDDNDSLVVTGIDLYDLLRLHPESVAAA